VNTAMKVCVPCIGRAGGGGEFTAKGLSRLQEDTSSWSNGVSILECFTS
jgi:hypothetical protein